jgi:hypothetical protein
MKLKVLPRAGWPKGSKRALSAKEERAAQSLICGKIPDQALDARCGPRAGVGSGGNEISKLTVRFPERPSGTLKFKESCGRLSSAITSAIG